MSSLSIIKRLPRCRPLENPVNLQWQLSGNWVAIEWPSSGHWVAIAGPLYPGVFRVLMGLSNTLGMLHKPYRIKRRQRCPLNFTELNSVKDGSSSVVVIPVFVVFFCPETNIMEYFSVQRRTSWSTVDVVYSRKSHNAPLPPKLNVETRVAKTFFSKSASRALQLWV